MTAFQGNSGRRRSLPGARSAEPVLRSVSRRRLLTEFSRLADDLLRQSPGRSRARDRRTEDHPGRHAEPRWQGLDLRGAVLATTSLGAIVFAITQAEGAGWTSAQTHLFGLGGLAGLAAFAAFERRTETPCSASSGSPIAPSAAGSS
jgi:hypothetical protein